MNNLQKFISSKPCGFLTDGDMPALIELDRLCPVLVRCGGCRFTCGAQYLDHMIKCIEAGGDYVRDVSFPVGAVECAAAWVPAGNGLVAHVPAPLNRAQDLALNQMPSRQTMADPAEKQNINAAGELQEVLAKRHLAATQRQSRQTHAFNESDCGGVFDGFGVTSDADPGL